MAVWLDGEKVTEEQMQIIGPGLFWGYGLFETIKINSGQVVFLDEHLKRLMGSAFALDLEKGIDVDGLHQDCINFLAENEINDGALKVTLFKGCQKNHILLTADHRKYSDQQYCSGMSLAISNVIRNESSNIIRHKTLQYFENILEKNKAVQLGYDDAILLNSMGFITETTVANLFFIKGDTIFTADQDTGILPGIVRDKVFLLAETNNICLEAGSYILEDLMESDMVFITNSLMGIMPVNRIDQKMFEISHPLFKKLQDAYLKLCREG